MPVIKNCTSIVLIGKYERDEASPAIDMAEKIFIAFNLTNLWEARSNNVQRKTLNEFCLNLMHWYNSNIMETLILKLDMRSKSAKVLKELITEMSRANKSIKVEQSPYDPEFVKMVKNSSASKNRTEIDPKNVWASIK